MSSPETSPENGHTTELEQLELRNLVLTEKKWETDVTAFREAVEHKLSPYGSNSEIVWAYFNVLEADDIGDTPRRKEVLLLMMPPVGKIRKSEEGVPVIRLMTNEMFQVENIKQYFAEDFMLDHERDALFLADAAVMSGWDKEANGPQQTCAPIFVAQGDNDLIFANIPFCVPTLVVEDPRGELPPAIPFGCYTSDVDRQFALESAWRILETVWDEYPKYSSTVN